MLIKSFSKTHIDRLVFKPNIKVNLGYQQKNQRLARFLKAYKKLRKKVALTDYIAVVNRNSGQFFNF
jgi:cell division protein FtsQ